MKRAIVIVLLSATLNISTTTSGFGDASLRDPYRIIAIRGQSAPGNSDGEFSGFFPPAINESGQTAFAGYSTGADGVQRLGVWSEGTGVLDVVALHELEPLGVPFTATGNEVNFAFNNRGDTVLHNVGIWLNRSGSTELVVAPGVPMTIEGQSYRFNAVSRPAINHDGQIAFIGRELVYSLGAFVITNGEFHKVADETTPLPGTSDYAYTDLRIPPAINSQGQLAAWGYGIWTNARGSIEAVARQHSTGSVPDFGEVGIPVITPTSKVAFTGRLRGSGVTNDNDASLWMFDANGLQLVGREGDHVAGLPNGVVVDSFSHPLVVPNVRPVSDELGNLALLGTVRGAGIDNGNNRAIWRTVNNQLELAVQAGTLAPGVEPERTFHLFDAPVLNGNGQLAFRARLHGTAEWGIWAEDRHNVLHLIVREGDTVDLDPGDGTNLQTIHDLFFASYSPSTQSLTFSRARGEGDQPYSFNNRGQIVFTADFEDGTRAILVSNAIAVPESGSLPLAVAGVLIASSRIRQRYRVN